MDYFLKIEKTNRVIAEVTGKRKREVGLVVPAKFTASTMKRRFAHVLDSELNSKKEKYAHYKPIVAEISCDRKCSFELHIIRIKDLISPLQRNAFYFSPVPVLFW